MNFDVIRRHQRVPKQDLVFRELFEDYRKAQRLNRKRTHQTLLAHHTHLVTPEDEIDYTKSEKTLSASRLTNIINSQRDEHNSPRDSRTHQKSSSATCLFRVTRRNRAKDPGSTSHFFNCQARDQLNNNKKLGYFRDTFTKENPSIPASIKQADFIKDYQKSLNMTALSLRPVDSKFPLVGGGAVFSSFLDNKTDNNLVRSSQRLEKMMHLKQKLSEFSKARRERLLENKRARIMMNEYTYTNESELQRTRKEEGHMAATTRLGCRLGWQEFRSTKENIFPQSSRQS